MSSSVKIAFYSFVGCFVFLLVGLFVGDLLTVQDRAVAIAVKCRAVVGGICWEVPSDPTGIFTFTEFLSVIALLAVVFTISDARYKFRLSIAPLPLFDWTFALAGFIGFATLLTDVWIKEKWLVPYALITQAQWRGLLGAMFVIVIFTWLYYAFIRPPIFSARNHLRFAQALFRVVVRGSEDELAVVADELGRSADALVTLCRRTGRPKECKPPSVGDYAHDVLLLIANKKLCRAIIKSASGTGIAFFDSMTSAKRYDVPLGAFASNLSAEAIRDKDSLLYHEEEGFHSGLVGYLKRFTLAVYGDYRLVESLGSQGRSPLDIHYEERWEWNAAQWEAFSRATLTTFEAYLKDGRWYEHSFTLYRAFGEFEHAGMRGSSPDKSNYFNSDAYARLRATVDFLEKAVDLIDKQEKVPEPMALRKKRDDRLRDKYDQIAHIMLEIIFHAAALDLDEDASWGVCYGTVWNHFFAHGKNGKAWRIVQRKLCRQIYDEIVEPKVGLNFKSARVLGFCLYVLGLVPHKRRKGDFDRGGTQLSRPLLEWTRKNYLRFVNERPDVAEAVLIGSLKYDVAGRRLSKSYIKGLNKEAPKEYLILN